MTHTAGIAPAIRQFYPQLHARQSEPIAHAEGPTPAITGPAAGNIPPIALRCGNIPAQGKAKSLGLAPGELLKTVRRLYRLETRLKQ